MVLSASEKREWKSVLKKSRKHKIFVKRTGPANVYFESGVYTQLGVGQATRIMDARIRLKKKYAKKRKRR